MFFCSPSHTLSAQIIPKPIYFCKPLVFNCHNTCTAFIALFLSYLAIKSLFGSKSLIKLLALLNTFTKGNFQRTMQWQDNVSLGNLGLWSHDRHCYTVSLTLNCSPGQIKINPSFTLFQLLSCIYLFFKFIMTCITYKTILFHFINVARFALCHY